MALEYKLLKSVSGTFVYVFGDKQLFTIHSEGKNGPIFLCKNRKTKCKCRIILQNNICIRKNNLKHNHRNEYEKEYQKLVFLSEIERTLLKNASEGIIMSSKTVFESTKNDYSISYDMVKCTIQRRQHQMTVGGMQNKPEDYLIQTIQKLNGGEYSRVLLKTNSNQYIKVLNIKNNSSGTSNT